MIKTVVESEGWQLFKEPDIFFCTSFCLTRKDVIEIAQDSYGEPWKKLYNRGYKVIKVKMIYETVIKK